MLGAGFAGLGRACVAVARLGEQVRRRAWVDIHVHAAKNYVFAPGCIRIDADIHCEQRGNFAVCVYLVARMLAQVTGATADREYFERLDQQRRDGFEARH